MVRRRSKTLRRKTSVAELWPGAPSYVIDPLKYLLKWMNDPSLSREQRGAIAKKLLPYFHHKLKPISLEELEKRALDDEESSAAFQEFVTLLNAISFRLAGSKNS